MHGLVSLEKIVPCSASVLIKKVISLFNVVISKAQHYDLTDNLSVSPLPARYLGPVHIRRCPGHTGEQGQSSHCHRVIDPDPHVGCGFGSRRAKMTFKYRKSKEFSCFEVPDVFFLGLKASPVLVRPLWRPWDH
jgi:hypothetical protein